MTLRNYSPLVLLALIQLLLASCNHKDLEFGEEIPTNKHSVRIVYDWRYAPDAEPASMELCMYPYDDPAHLSFNLIGKEGGYIALPENTYDIISMNNDDLDWALYRNTDDKENFEVYTHNAEELGAYQMLAEHLRGSRASTPERLAATPEMSWSTRSNGITIDGSDGEQIITLYPKEIVCHYYVEVRNVKNIDSARGQILNGTLSGMAEGYRHGSSISTDTPVTMPFVLGIDYENDKLTAEFLTFGECNSAKAKHNLGVYLFMGDGTKWEKSFDVDSQVVDAPDPTHVHIIIDGLEFPKVENSGGLNPSVTDWNTEVVDVKM